MFSDAFSKTDFCSIDWLLLSSDSFDAWSATPFLVPEILNGKTYNATVIGLSPWVEYEFRVVAGNSIGIGEPSKASELLRTKASGKKLF